MPDNKPTKHAETHWEIADIKSLRPGWADEYCREWLDDSASRIVDAMVSTGWDVIHSILAEENGSLFDMDATEADFDEIQIDALI